MASYQVLSAPQNIGFLTGLGRGVEDTAGKYSDAMFKRKKTDYLLEQNRKENALLADQKQGNMNKFAEAMKQGGFDISGAHMNADGTPSYSYKPKAAPETTAQLFTKDPIKAMRQAVMSPQSAAELGPQLGVTQPPEPMMTEGLAPNLQSLLSPRQNDMFSQTESYATPEAKQSKYAEAVKSKIAESMAPGLPQDKGIRELFNVPQETAQEKTMTTDDFATDISDLVDASGDDQEAFVQSLGQLGAKYADNPTAMAKIQKLIQLNKSSMPKKTAEDAYLDKLNF